MARAALGLPLRQASTVNSGLALVRRTPVP